MSPKENVKDMGTPIADCAICGCSLFDGDPATGLFSGRINKRSLSGFAAERRCRVITVKTIEGTIEQIKEYLLEFYISSGYVVAVL